MRALMYFIAFSVMILGCAFSILSALGRLPLFVAENLTVIYGIVASMLIGFLFLGVGVAIGRARAMSPRVDSASRETVIRSPKASDSADLQSLLEPEAGQQEQPAEDQGEVKDGDDEFFLITPEDQQ